MTPSDKVDILLVDDRPENLLALEAILEPLGQRLVRATSGDEALRAVLSRDFALILLDVQMPGMSGLEAARLIKARERSKYIPIIFLTAISKEESYVFEGYSVGAVDYIFKPFQPNILRSKVSVFVDLHLKQQQIKRQEELLRESERREIELRHRAELRESELRLAEIVGSAMDAIILLDEDYRITLFNTAAEQMFCCSAVEAVGEPADRFFPERLRDEYRTLLRTRRPVQAMAECGEPAPLALQVESLIGLRVTGEEFPMETSISSVDLGGRRVYTMIARDVTERHKVDEALRTQAMTLTRKSTELRIVNAQLNERQEELERAMTARSRFYASMSHELRTPINAILGYSTLLLESIYGPLNDKQIEGLQRTHKAAKHLLELVNDVLDLSKIEAGKIELKLQPVNFPELIEDLFVTVRPMADENGCDLAFEHLGEPCTVVTDPRRVRQILLNLLSNAIKFGRERPIRVRSRAVEGGGVVLTVADQGPGIPAEDQARIFDEFVQLSKGQYLEGTGLGLPISRRLAMLLHGRLEVESQVGEGSTFRLVLPDSAEPRASAPADTSVNLAASSDSGVPADRPPAAEGAEPPEGVRPSEVPTPQPLRDELADRAQAGR